MDSTTLKNDHYVFHQIIRKPKTTANIIERPMFLIDPKWSTGTPSQPGLPTFKIIIATSAGNKTREYLPIQYSETLDAYLNNIPGTTWIPTQPANLRKEIHMLAVTNAPIFQDITIHYQWDNEIDTDQLTVTNINQKPARQRIWDIAKGKSHLRNNLLTPAHSNKSRKITSIKNPKKPQLITVTIALWKIKETPTLETLLQRGLIKNPHFGNLYLRYCKNKLNFYYVLRNHPSQNGITVEYGDINLFFHRIQPLTDPKYLFIYKIISKLKGPQNWTSLFHEEIHVLSQLMSPAAHDRLIRAL